MSYMSYPQRSTRLEYLGFPQDYGPWTYRAVPDPFISSELARLASAHIITGKASTTSCVSLQPCPDPNERSQDRFVVLDWDGWSFAAVFDVGHGGEEAVDYVIEELPSFIRTALIKALTDAGTTPIGHSTVSSLLQSSIQAVDDALTNAVKRLFPDEVALAALTDEQIKSTINSPFNANNLAILRCMRGTTALVSLVDPKKENLWVASLGDCQAVLGVKSSNGTWDATILSANHNGTNHAEVARIRKEHPGESECVKSGRVLGAIAVTRAIGDHIFKLPSSYTNRVFMNCVPGFRVSTKLEDLLPRIKSPPYLSALADIQHVALSPSTTNKCEAFLILCSDGLVDLYRYTKPRRPALQEIATQWVHALGERIDGKIDKVGGEDNTALVLLRHALMGGREDPDRLAQMLTLEIPWRWMDDTTVLVQSL